MPQAKSNDIPFNTTQNRRRPAHINPRSNRLAPIFDDLTSIDHNRPRVQSRNPVGGNRGETPESFKHRHPVLIAVILWIVLIAMVLFFERRQVAPNTPVVHNKKITHISPSEIITNSTLPAATTVWHENTNANTNKSIAPPQAPIINADVTSTIYYSDSLKRETESEANKQTSQHAQDSDFAKAKPCTQPSNEHANRNIAPRTTWMSDSPDVFLKTDYVMVPEKTCAQPSSERTDRNIVQQAAWMSDLPDVFLKTDYVGMHEMADPRSQQSFLRRQVEGRRMMIR